VFGGFVGHARKKYGIPYPTMYAIPGTKADYSPSEMNLTEAPLADSGVISDEAAYAFNCVQRGHQNYLESVATFVPLLIINWFTFPLITGIAGIVWGAFKWLYFFGYMKGHNNRVWGVGGYIPLLVVLVLTFVSCAYLYELKEAL
jgi:glutathione S-transferase